MQAAKRLGFGSAIAAALVLAVAVGTQPAAARMSDRHARMFQIIDADHDGVVTREEYMAYRGLVFARMDLDKDGTISHDEFMAEGRRYGRMPMAGGTMREQRFKALNKSGSGAISKAEWDVESGEVFALRDKNGDRRLTPDEFGPLMMHGQQF
jgi:hypothetical protein